MSPNEYTEMNEKPISFINKKSTLCLGALNFCDPSDDYRNKFGTNQGPPVPIAIGRVRCFCIFLKGV